MPTPESRLHLEVIGRVAETPAIDRDRLRRLLDAALGEAGIASASLTVELVDDARSAALHRAHFDDPAPTDVMTFPDGACDPETGLRHLGDLAVGVDVARRVARERHGDAGRAGEELELYILHGLLHLLGYDDRTPADRAAMWRRQRALLRAEGIEIGPD